MPREVVLQAGKSPDTNALDAAIFVFMSRYQQEVCRGYSFDEIRRSTQEAYRKITSGVCRRVANRVRRNMKKIIAMQGGNFYAESTSRKIDLNIDPPCAVCTSTYTAEAGVHAMLFCEGCDTGTHVECAKLKAVPRGEWLCKACKKKK